MAGKSLADTRREEEGRVQKKTDQERTIEMKRRAGELRKREREEGSIGEEKIG